MANLSLRKDFPQGLTNAQIDANFTNLNNDLSFLQNTQSINDWHAISGNGKYMGAGAANAPAGSPDWFIGEAIAHDSGCITVYAHAFTVDFDTNSQLWKCHKNNGTWTNWVRCYETEAELDERYLRKSGDIMAGVFRPVSGTGLNAGIKGSGDQDTGFEWHTDGTLNTLVDGVLRQTMQPSDTTFINNDFKTSLQTDGNLVIRNNADSVLWDAFSGVTQTQRASDNSNNQTKFLSLDGTNNMTGVLRVAPGVGLNAGLKSAGDQDTGFEFPSDGVRTGIINGVMTERTDSDTHSFYSNLQGRKFVFQADGNIVSYDSANNPIWYSFNTYQKSDYSASYSGGLTYWERTPHPNFGNLIKQSCTGSGTQIVRVVYFPIPFPNAVLNISVSTVNTTAPNDFSYIYFQITGWSLNSVTLRVHGIMGTTVPDSFYPVVNVTGY